MPTQSRGSRAGPQARLWGISRRRPSTTKPGGSRRPRHCASWTPWALRQAPRRTDPPTSASADARLPRHSEGPCGKQGSSPLLRAVGSGLAGRGRRGRGHLGRRQHSARSAPSPTGPRHREVLTVLIPVISEKRPGGTPRARPRGKLGMSHGPGHAPGLCTPSAPGSPPHASRASAGELPGDRLRTQTGSPTT